MNGQQDLERILAACLSPDNVLRAQAESTLKATFFMLATMLCVSLADLAAR